MDKDRIKQAVTAALDRALDEVAAAGSTTEQLNQTARRMRLAENREVWIRAFLERASDYCERAALFAVRGRTLRFEGGLGLEDNGDGPETTLEAAPAFAEAVRTRDTVVSVASPRELSPEVAALFGGDGSRSVYLFPFLYRGSVAGILCAEGGGPATDLNGLELLATLAEMTLETEPEAPRTKKVLPWEGLPGEEQHAHAEAERFARARVAELILYRAGAVKTGRESKRLYATLKEEIDAGRNAFREQFLGSNRSVPDYFDAELVRTLAMGDASLLGEGYPGPLG
jgi:hypothetical protein